MSTSEKFEISQHISSSVNGFEIPERFIARFNHRWKKNHGAEIFPAVCIKNFSKENKNSNEIRSFQALNIYICINDGTHDNDSYYAYTQDANGKPGMNDHPGAWSGVWLVQEEFDNYFKKI